MSFKIQSYNGQTKMLPKLIGMVSTRLLMDIQAGTDSRGIVTFENYDYEITIKKVKKKRWANWFGLRKKPE